jgi:NAD(P) transhydrogenase
MRDHYNLCVIGGGPAGEKGAAQAAYFGKSVCLVERAPRAGGAAVHTGTLPSKTLRETALYFHGLRQRGLYGVDIRVKPDLSIGDFMHRERAVADAAWAAIDANLARHEVDRIRGTARFVSPDAVEVTHFGDAPRRLTADVFLVATGARPARPAGIPFDGRVVVDPDEVLTLSALPGRLVIIGGGTLGCEYAGIFAALGARVTLVTDRPRVLGQFDADVSDAVAREMTRRLGVQVATDMVVTDIRVTGDIATVTLGDGRILHADCVLHCVSRVGNAADLGLEVAGVPVGPQGFIPVDATYRTANPRIVAAGDVAGLPALASLAMEEARVAVCHAFGIPYKQAVSPFIPMPVWSVPEVASVGLGEEAARGAGVLVETGRAAFRDNARGQILGETEGFVKLVFRVDDRRLVGASVMGEAASELIHIPAAVLQLGGTLDYFIDAVFNYPTLADTFKYAAYDGLQRLSRRVTAAMAPRAGGTPSGIPTVPSPDRA